MAEGKRRRRHTQPGVAEQEPTISTELSTAAEIVEQTGQVPVVVPTRDRSRRRRRDRARRRLTGSSLMVLGLAAVVGGLFVYFGWGNDSGSVPVPPSVAGTHIERSTTTTSTTTTIAPTTTVAPTTTAPPPPPTTTIKPKPKPKPKPATSAPTTPPATTVPGASVGVG